MAAKAKKEGTELQLREVMLTLAKVVPVASVFLSILYNYFYFKALDYKLLSLLMWNDHVASFLSIFVKVTIFTAVLLGLAALLRNRFELGLGKGQDVSILSKHCVRYLVVITVLTIACGYVSAKSDLRSQRVAKSEITLHKTLRKKGRETPLIYKDVNILKYIHRGVLVKDKGKRNIRFIPWRSIRSISTTTKSRASGRK